MADRSSAEDHYLVTRVVATRDTAAFGELVQKHHAHVRNFLRKLTGDAALADDLAQDCFIKAWDKLSGFAGRGSFIGWLLKIAYTTFLQSKRKSRRYSEILEEVAHVAAINGQTATRHSEETPDLSKLLAVLESRERTVMVLAYACGLSHREITEVTDLPAGTVKSLIYRSKIKIRNHFDIKDHKHG